MRAFSQILASLGHSRPLCIDYGIVCLDTQYEKKERKMNQCNQFELVLSVFI